MKIGDIMYPTTIETIKTYLEDYSIKPSLQRIIIYKYLSVNRSHPTVEEIYHNLSPDLITLSKTTVYNTLHLFVDKGIAIPIHVEGNEVRYDADISNHGHFKCNKCGNIYDIPVDFTSHNFKELSGYDVDEFQIFMRGTCMSCKKKLSKKSN